MWRFNNNAQPSAFAASDFTIIECPAPKLTAAAGTAATTVTLTFDRNIAQDSITNAASQFTFSNGLMATGAQVTGRQVAVTTTDQTAGAAYTVTVANTVTDSRGVGVAASNSTANFTGFRVVAVLRITEVQPNGPSSRDLVELQVLQSGTTDGLVLQQDINSPATLLTFPNVTVAQGDIIVVHINEATAYVGETTAKDQFPKSATPANYDNAWDFKGGTTGITFSNRLLLVKDASGAIQDAAAFARTTGTPPSAFPTNLQALQATGQWLPADCGGALCTYTSTPTAVAVSADWNDIPTTQVTPDTVTIRRVSATDTNTAADWAIGPSSWGVANP
ncbi:Ig-like domain-containing protein [Myxococcus sp. K38C18041901]|nr:Ig-like domain-containing protein [Myxococcus guangdongensis]